MAEHDDTAGSHTVYLGLGSNIGDVYGEDAWKWMLIGPTMEK